MPSGIISLCLRHCLLLSVYVPLYSTSTALTLAFTHTSVQRQQPLLHQKAIIKICALSSVFNRSFYRLILMLLDPHADMCSAHIYFCEHDRVLLCEGCAHAHASGSFQGHRLFTLECHCSCIHVNNHARKKHWNRALRPAAWI